jgi:biotin carboxyl carrier protein
MKYTVTVAERSYEIEVDHDRLVWVDGRPLYVDLEQVGGLPVYSLALDDNGYVLFVDEGQDGSPSMTTYEVEVQGQIYPVAVQLQRPKLSRQIECSGEGGECLVVCAPLAGRLLSLPVSVGDRVDEGQVVAIVESMKMKMELRAPCPGVVEEVNGAPEQDVSQGEELVFLRAD